MKPRYLPPRDGPPPQPRRHPPLTRVLCLVAMAAATWAVLYAAAALIVAWLT
jgi:hypothetical protein